MVQGTMMASSVNSTGACSPDGCTPESLTGPGMSSSAVATLSSNPAQIEI
jgi:hypothetical protein